MTNFVKKLCWVFLMLATFTPALADEDGKGPQFIRDAEIENYLRDLAAPIYRAADINPDSISIAIVRSNAINAFVAGGMNEFFYTGLLQLADTPEQLAGVIAHETGHISGGHLVRGQEEMRNASTQAILGMLLSVAAGAVSGNGQAAAGAISGTQHLVQRSVLGFTRSQESSADAAGLSFLDKANVSEQGMLEFFQKLENQELLPPDRQMEYVQTHPLTRDRIDAVRQHLQTSSSKNLKLDPKFYTMHERMKAKLMGFLQPETALLRYTDKDPRITARYARAIALYQTNQMDRAVGIIDGMIKEEPNNPFFQELKGQILFENGKVIESIPYYKKANDLLSDSALLHEAYGHALLETKDNSKLDLAIQQLLESNRLEGRVPTTWRFLAAAWGRKAELTKDKQYDGMVSYALAEEAVAKGADKEASQFAERAMKALPKGTAYWLRAQDIKLTTGPDADNPRDNDKDSKKQKP